MRLSSWFVNPQPIKRHKSIDEKYRDLKTMIYQARTCDAIRDAERKFRDFEHEYRNDPDIIMALQSLRADLIQRHDSIIGFE
jgi:hypothetical protein